MACFWRLGLIHILRVVGFHKSSHTSGARQGCLFIKQHGVFELFLELRHVLLRHQTAESLFGSIEGVDGRVLGLDGWRGAGGREHASLCFKLNNSLFPVCL